jgi:hypothetical protein
MHQVVAKCSDVSEEHTASIFMVTELVQDDEMLYRKKIIKDGYWVFGQSQLLNVGRSDRTVLSQLELRPQRTVYFWEGGSAMDC